MKVSNLFYASSSNSQLPFILLLGFASGVPFLLTLSTLSFWLTECDIDKTTIGLFMLMSIPYSLKFIWAPLIDCVPLPFLSKKLGQRRAWALFSQTSLIISILNLGYCNPAESVVKTAFSAFLVSIFSATQDIVYDAYRIEIIKDRQGGTAAALESIGFRLGMLVSGAGALYLASMFDWKIAYHFMAGAILVGVITVFLMPEPKHQRTKPIDRNTTFLSSIKKHPFSIIEPWHQFKNKHLFLKLGLFILCFKLADAVMNSMSAPFLHDLGFSKTDFANISKVFGIIFMIIGGFSGGFLINRRGILPSIVFCVLLQGISCLMFCAQAMIGHNYSFLVMTIGIESFCSGLTSTIFIAYVSGFCCQPYTASHFTLLYAFGSLARVLTSTLAGWIADYCHWHILFFFCSFFCIPAILLAVSLERNRHLSKESLPKK